MRNECCGEIAPWRMNDDGDFYCTACDAVEEDEDDDE